MSALTPTRAQIRQDIGIALGDCLPLTATDSGTTACSANDETELKWRSSAPSCESREVPSARVPVAARRHSDFERHISRCDGTSQITIDGSMNAAPMFECIMAPIAMPDVNVSQSCCRSTPRLPTAAASSA